MRKLFNDITSDIDLPSESEINEDTRRAKISHTANAKMQYDKSFQESKLRGGRKAGEAKRKVPVADYKNIIMEYWDRDTMRPLRLNQTIADRYGVKFGVIDNIIMNVKNTLSDSEYNKLVKRYRDKFGGQSEVAKLVHKEGLRDAKAAGKNISIAKNTISRADALKIYDKSFSCAEGRTHKFYKKLATEYGVTWGKIRDTANGHHPALSDKDIKADVRQHEIKYKGIYKFTSPCGKEYVFDNLYDVGAWLWKTEHGITDKLPQENWGKGRMWFEQTEPNVLYVKQRRFWKGWEYINICQEFSH
jgi:hypothetical protein